MFSEGNTVIALGIWKSQSAAEIAAIDSNLGIVRTQGKIPSNLHL